MSRTDELEKPVTRSGYLVVMKPRRKILNSEFALVSTDIYKASFDLGRIISLRRVLNSAGQLFTAMTEGTSASVAIDEFYYDTDAQEIYIGITAANLALNTYYVEYEIYVSTIGVHANRIPTDTTENFVYFEPQIITEPNLIDQVSDTLFGFLPVTTSEMVLANDQQFWNRHISDSSFNQAGLDLYHFAVPGDDPATATDIKKIISGIMKSPTWSQSKVRFQVLNRVDVLNSIREGDTYTDTDFNTLDPAFEGKPIREVYGMVDGFVPVNLDFVEDSPTTSDNRIWGVIKKPALSSELGSVTATVGSGSTATNTEVDDATGFVRFDSVEFDRVSGSDEYINIGTSNETTDTLVHSTLAGGAMASGDTLRRSFVGNIEIERDGVIYKPQFIRDYTETYDAGGAGLVSGFTFTASMESNVGLPSALTPSDKVTCRVYGLNTLPTISAAPFGSVDAEYSGSDYITGTAVKMNPVVIIYELLREIFSEDEINTSDFSSLESSVSSSISFAIPRTSGDDFQSYKEIILQILESDFLRLFTDEDGLWTIRQVGPLGTVDKALDNGDLNEGSLNYQFDYEDIISRAIINYQQAEEAHSMQTGGFGRDVRDTQRQTKSVFSGTALNLHRIDRRKEFNTVLSRKDDATTIARRFLIALLDRRGLLSVAEQNRLFDNNIDDVVSITRTKLPGFAYDQDTERTKSFSLEDKRRNLTGVSMVLDDQKGIEDNSGVW